MYDVSHMLCRNILMHIKRKYCRLVWMEKEQVRAMSKGRRRKKVDSNEHKKKTLSARVDAKRTGAKQQVCEAMSKGRRRKKYSFYIFKIIYLCILKTTYKFIHTCTYMYDLNIHDIMYMS